MSGKRAVVILIAMFAMACVSGQQRGRIIVTGTVTDTLMRPVRGVLIVADGQSTGVKTRSDGTYRVKLRENTQSLGAYTTNLGSAITALEGGRIADFVLDGTDRLPGFTTGDPEGEQEIDIGYATRKRKNLTTNVGYIDAQDNAFASYTSIYDMIQGRVPGVTVSGNKIVIRGKNSIMLSSDPLLVVDGLVVSSIDHINPRQVKSISVLKGSDAAIYGSRAAGGVILITLLGTER